MRQAISALDRILRGESTRLPDLQQGRFQVPVVSLTMVVVVLCALYGICMGTFAMLRPEGPRFMQVLASMLKVPALFLLTLLVTFPSLYVFNALVGSQLRLPSVLKLLVAALGVTTAVLASLGPIEAFFALSTTSYDFMILLNVLIFAIAGVLGLKFLLQTLHRLSVAQVIQIWEEPAASPEPPPAEAPAEPEEPPGEPASEPPSDPLPPPRRIGFPPVVNPALRPKDGLPTPSREGPLDKLQGHVLGAHTKLIFRLWVIVFGLVGAQMAWILRPFVGDPNSPFAWFRPRESNFFQAVLQCIHNLF